MTILGTIPQPAAIQNLRALYGSPYNFKGSIDAEQISAMGANASRNVTDEELERDIGLVRCESDYCLKGLEALPSGMEFINISPATGLLEAPVTSTTLSVGPTPNNLETPTTPQQGVTSAAFPQRTQDGEFID